MRVQIYSFFLLVACADQRTPGDEVGEASATEATGESDMSGSGTTGETSDTGSWSSESSESESSESDTSESDTSESDDEIGETAFDTGFDTTSEVCCCCPIHQCGVWPVDGWPSGSESCADYQEAQGCFSWGWEPYGACTFVDGFPSCLC